MYKTLRKVLLVSLLATSVVCGSLFAAACTPNNGHTHSYVFKSDGEAGHHQECKDGDDTKATENHNFGDDNKCTDCGYVKGSAHTHDYKYVSDGEKGHHQECKDGDDKKAIEDHKFGTDNKCTDCGYEKDLTPKAEKLDAPANVKIENDVLTWDAVDHAISYSVFINGNFYILVDADNADGLKVNLKKADLAVGSYSITVVANGDGENYDDSPASDPITYKVELIPVIPDGGSEHWYPEVSWTIDWKHEEGDPYTITSTGAYKIPVKFTGSGWGATIYADVIEFTAPEAGEHSYIFSWEINDVYGIKYLNGDLWDTGFANFATDIDDDCLVDDSEYGSLVFSLEQGAKVTLVLWYQDNTYQIEEGDDISYVFVIESGDPITEGSLYNPIELDEIEGTHTTPDGYNKTEAYFSLPMNESSYTYAVTFADGVEVAILAFGRNSNPAEITSGFELTPAQYNSTYIYVTAPAGTALSFTLTKTERTGTTENPIALTKDTETSYIFTGFANVWYTFAPAASQVYHINYNEYFSGLTIYESVDGFAIFDIYEGGATDFYLESGKTYYFELVSSFGNTVTFTITDATSVKGGILDPIVLDLGENAADFTNSKYVYFKYTPSLDGTLHFSFDESLFGVYVYLYSDVNYSVSIGDPHDESFTCSVTADTTLYIAVSSSITSLSFNLELQLPAPKASLDGNKLTWAAVEGAAGYTIYDGDEALDRNVSSDTLEYDVSSLTSGAHRLTVVANGFGNYLRSDNSNVVIYSVPFELDTNEEGIDIVLANTVVTVNLQAHVSFDTQYALVLSSAADTSDDDFLDFFTGATYTINYNGTEHVLKADGYEPVYRELDWNMLLITFSSGITSFTIEAPLPEGASLLEVNISLVEMSNDDLHLIVLPLELGVAFKEEPLETRGSAWQYSFIAPDYGTYTLKLTDLTGITSADDVIVNVGDVLTGTLSDGTLTYTFAAELGDEFAIGIYNETNEENPVSISYTVTIILTLGDFVGAPGLEDGASLTVTVEGSSAQVKLFEKTFVSPVNAKYKIEMTGATASQVYVRTESGSEMGSDNLIEWGGETTAEFKLSADGIAILGFYLSNYGSDQSYTVTLTITRLEIIKEYLAPGNDPVSLKIASDKDGAGEVELDPEKFTNGDEYTIFVAMTTQMMSVRATELTLYYNGEELTLKITTADDEYDDGYVGTFTYNSDANSMWVYNIGFNSVMKTKISIIVKVEGLTVGGTITLNPEDVGDGYGMTAFQQGGKEIPLLIPSSGRYKITITPGAPGDYSKTFFVHDGTVKSQVNGSYTGYFEAGSMIRILVNGGGSSLNAPITVSLDNP